jgi:hypothetical protein
MKKVSIFLVIGLLVIVFNSLAFGRMPTLGDAYSHGGIKPENNKIIEEPKKQLIPSTKTFIDSRDYDRYRYPQRLQRSRKIEHEFYWTFSLDGDSYFKDKRWGVSGSYRILIGN